MKRNKRSGFTLLELLIVVIIVGVLATVALPQFGKMVKKSRAAEGLNTLGALLTAESVYFQENGTFTSSLTDLLVTTSGSYTYAAAGTATEAKVTATGTGKAEGIVITGTVLADGSRTEPEITGI